MSLIMIDPGHGGQDPGAIANGLQEKDLNLSICLGLSKLLEARGQNAGLTRSGDVFISLRQRCEIANNSKAALFLSVHCNASENAAAAGIEAFHAGAGGAGEKFAQTLCRSLSKLGRQVRGAKPADYYVLRHTVMPACLVECGFVSNPEEAAWLKNHVSEIAQALADGIIEYLS
jgi:N-acetylmuramoyl-L-alanine amidase